MAPCKCSRSELNQHLRDCGYDTNAPMFSCFFRREGDDASGGGAGTIVCLSCGHPIGDHSDDNPDGGAGVAVVMGTVEASGAPTAAAVADSGGGEGDPMDDRVAPPPLPVGVVAKGTYDEVVIDPKPSAWVVPLALGLCVALIVFPAAVTLTVVGSSAEDARTGYPVLFCGLVLFSACLGYVFWTACGPPWPRKHTVRFSRGRFRKISHGSVNSFIKDVCGHDQLEFTELSVKDLKSVQLLSWGARGHAKLFEAEVDLAFHNLHVVPVFAGQTANPEAVAQSWRVYLRPDSPGTLAHIERSRSSDPVFIGSRARARALSRAV